MTQLVPYPPDSGGKIRCLNVIRHLSRRHKVTLVAFARDPRESAHRAELERYCREVRFVFLKRSRMRDLFDYAAAFFSQTPFTIRRDFRPEMAGLVEVLSATEAFDIVHVDQINMAQYARFASGARVVIDAHNAVHRLYADIARECPVTRPEKLPLALESLKMRRYEGRACAEADAVVTVTENDRSLLKALAPDQPNFEVVPIGVDLKERPPAPACGSRQVLFIGTLDYKPNFDGLMWFCRHVLPLARSAMPDLELAVVGGKAPRALVELAGRERVSLLGYVPDLGPYIRGSSLTVVPLRMGSGMRVKILDSLASGLPVVSTSIGCEGIDVESRKNIIVADTPEDFARAIVEIVGDRELASNLAAGGYELVKSKYDWQATYEAFDRLYERAEAGYRVGGGSLV